MPLIPAHRYEFGNGIHAGTGPCECLQRIVRIATGVLQRVIHGNLNRRLKIIVFQFDTAGIAVIFIGVQSVFDLVVSGNDFGA